MTLKPTPATSLLLCLFPVALLGACAMPGPADTMAMPAFSQSALPAAVQVPAGHKVAMETVGAGKITYECQAKADLPGQHAWVFVGPDATLTDRRMKKVGTYFGPPATWASEDGSKVTGKQLAVAPGAPGSIPMQLVKADPASGMGAMQGVSYIQRVATQGGVAPKEPCDASTVGRRQVVSYQADYIFWTPAM